jgi:hypothetical protein
MTEPDITEEENALVIDIPDTGELHPRMEVLIYDTPVWDPAATYERAMILEVNP